MQTVLSIVGLPGAGKSTVAYAVAAALNASILSTGESLRGVARQNPSLARALSEGKLGPEDLVKQFVDEFLAEHRIAILDGYPRHREQAAYLLTKTSRLIVAHLVVEPAVRIRRIRQRTLRDDYTD